MYFQGANKKCVSYLDASAEPRLNNAGAVGGRESAILSRKRSLFIFLRNAENSNSKQEKVFIFLRYFFLQKSSQFCTIPPKHF